MPMPMASSVVHTVQNAKLIGMWMTATAMLPSFVWAAPDWHKTPPVVPSLLPDAPMYHQAETLPKDETLPQGDAGVIDAQALMADVNLFTDVLDFAVEQGAWQMVAELLPLYASLSEHDRTLYHFASAGLYEQSDVPKAIYHYEQALLIADLTPIKTRLIYAYLAAGRTKSAIGLIDEVLKDPDLPVTLQHQLMARQKQMTSVSARILVRYLADDNVNQAPTRTQWGNWQLSPAESAHGIGYDLDLRRSFYPADHYRITPSVRIFAKNYWDNSPYNDRIYELSAAIGHRQEQTELMILPYYQQRYFGGEAYGTRTGVRAQLTQQYPDATWQLGLGYANKKHDERQHLDGDSYELTTVLAKSRANHSVYLSGGLIQDNARYPSDSYFGHLAQVGAEHRLGEWGMSYQLGFAARRYQDKDVFGIWRQDKNYTLAGSVWHHKLSFRGYLPRLNYQLDRRDSTHFAYDTRSSAMFVDIQKRF